jgi:uncharacterized protein YecT (DUF1311 family)
MKASFLIFLCLLLCATGRSQEKGAAETCEQKAQTQLDLNTCAADKLRSEDAKLDRVYQELLAKAKNDPVATAKIRSAQQAWVAFRDAQLEALFPADDKQDQYGSAYPMCAASARAQLTAERARMLESMLHPVEGEMCSH